MLMKLTAGVNFTNILAESTNFQVQGVWHNEFFFTNNTAPDFTSEHN